MRVGGEVKNYKLKPGEAVTYPTGMDHCVRPVTKGERKHLSFGLKPVTDPLLREITLFQIRLIIISKKKRREKENPYLLKMGLNRLSNDPLFLMDKIFSYWKG